MNDIIVRPHVQILLVIVMLMVSLVGCATQEESPIGFKVESGSEEQPKAKSPLDAEQSTPNLANDKEIPQEWAGQIGREFTDWIPSDYHLDRNKSDSLSGPGGRWLTYYFTSKHGQAREVLLQQYADFFEGYGWLKKQDKVRKEWVLSKRHAKPHPDYVYQRGAFPYQKSYWRSRSYVYISDDGSVIIQYGEVGW